MTVAQFRGPGVDADDADGVSVDLTGDDDEEVGSLRPTPIADSPFAALEAAMKTPLPKEHLALSPLGRPNVEVRLRSNVILDEINEWRKGAKDPSFDGGYDLARYACILLANTCVDIQIDGKSTGVTLADKRIQQMYPQAADEVEAVRQFFGGEDLWLAGRVLPALTTAWTGGEQDGEILRPTTQD